MGNACSSCKESGCFAWLIPKKPNNLPSKSEPVDRPKPVTPVYGESVDFLIVKKFDWKTCDNGPLHHTAQYELMEREKPRLVLRRGQEFTIVLETNQKMDEDKDKISLVFSVVDAKNPNFGNQTLVGIGIGVEPCNGWSASVEDITDCSITLKVNTSSKAIVGEWKLEVDVKSGDKVHSFPCSDTFFVLFNPWCEDDAVYLEGDAEKKEYVLNDSGLIWRGTTKCHRPCPWNFAQFEEHVMECVLYVLTSVCKMSPSNRSDPVKVTRAISAGVNSPDDAGVLVGNWSTDYSGGCPPTKWRGSQLILQEYYKTKKPVKYGQCWVFSGVVTTACRALGIPSRSITNFSSAHDTHNSLTIDYFFDDEGEVIERLNSDSVWNFHVWNEVWMTREDLAPDYNGWQAIDATPQEESDGQYRCGPASLVAIKKGEIHRSYDVPFVFAEVNADKLFWKYRGSCQPMKLLGKKTDGIGQFLSTKAVGRYIRDDVTHLYKYAEESEEERNVMRDALRRCENVFARYYLNEEIEDVEFDFQMNDDIVIGQPFTSSVVVHNKSGKDFDVEILLRADTVMYTGAVKEMVKKHKQYITVKPYTKETVTMEVSFTEYYCKLADQCAFNLSCLAKVKQTDFEYFAQDDFRCRKPDIKIEHEGEMMVRKETKCTASFTNPLPMALTQGRFIIQGAGLTRVQFIKLKESIPVGGEAKCEFMVKPIIGGERTLTVMFDSRQLEDVDGLLTLEVAEVPVPALDSNGSDQPAASDAVPNTTTEEILEETLSEEA
ncbi:annulin-like isoform X2 [Homarus americanus]|uniref:annulin-like isoform X2 n=1 Tax=Homarus americanus TaxID=6706 RepID=UPI001C491B97|nr:annulin-like isoform X2 [Homarus americanus]